MLEVTKAMMESFVENGMTVAEIAEALTKMAQERGYDKKCSDNNVREIAKYYGINLRRKSKPKFFVPVEEVETVENIISKEEESNVVEDSAVAPSSVGEVNVENKETSIGESMFSI